MAYLSNSRHIHVRRAHRIQKPVENKVNKHKTQAKHETYKEILKFYILILILSPIITQTHFSKISSLYSLCINFSAKENDSVKCARQGMA